jgi:pilus assembly protein Flp/PilA
MNVSALILAARSLVADRKGVTALEYGLIAALMSAGIIAAFAILTPALSGVFTRVATTLAG